LPGGGKTTMSLKFAEFFGNNFGKVKYLSSEMGISDGLKSMVKRVGMTSDKVFFDKSKKPLNMLINELNTKGFKMLIIDSANYIGYSPEDIESIKNEVKGLSTFIILQSTKDGKFRGANDYAHNADVILKVADLEVFTEKTRFAAKNVAGMPIN
jgi:predicted ATP-dependent serine protease